MENLKIYVRWQSDLVEIYGQLAPPIFCQLTPTAIWSQTLLPIPEKDK